MPGGKPRYDCAVDAAMSVIEGRWKTTILCMLAKDGDMRFTELQRRIGGVTPRILSKQLKELESDGMVRRNVSQEGRPKVTYSVTGKGESICPILAQLAAWGMENQMVSVILPEEDERPVRRSSIPSAARRPPHRRCRRPSSATSRPPPYPSLSRIRPDSNVLRWSWQRSRLPWPISRTARMP